MGWQEGAEGRGRWQRVAGPFVSCHDAGCVQATGHGALCDLRDRNAAGSLVSPLFLEDEAGQVGKEWSCKESLQSHPIPAARVFGASWKRFPSLWWEPLRPDLSSMAGRDPSMPKLAWTEEEEAKVNAPPAQQPHELTEVQVLQAGWDQPEQEQQQHQEQEAIAVELDKRVLHSVIPLHHAPGILRSIYQWLVSNTEQSAQHRLDRSLLELAEEHPHDVVVTLLRCSPACDRAAVTMWRVMVVSSRTKKKVMAELCRVLKDWPFHRTSTSDGDNTDVFALAATRVLWELLRPANYPMEEEMSFSLPLMVLLFQIFASAQQTPEEVETFFRECQQEEGIATSPSRFALLTLKALLCRVGYDMLVLELGKRNIWEMLLHAESHHWAVGLLARAMKHVSRTERRQIVLYLETWLINNEPRWKVPAMAFLVEMLACKDLKMECLRVMQLFPRYLRSECTAVRQLVLKGLKTLSRRPYVAKKMEFLLPEIMGILPELEGDVAGNALFVLKNMLKEMTISKANPTALQLAERLPAFFDSESSSTQLQSIHFFRAVMSRLFAAREKEQLKTHVRQSVIPLFFHLHDENQQVAEAAEETLLDAAKFLQRTKLVDLLERKQTWRLGKCLLEDNSLGEHLRQSLPYLQSPQEPLRLEAVTFIGLIARRVRDWREEELPIIYEAIQGMTDDVSSSVSSLATETLFIIRAAMRLPRSVPGLRGLSYRLWKARKKCSALAFLCCCCCAQG
ncbi:maestro heat-like repeat-containing protein family member 6 [Anas platyrhynchos]|uniref:maestro heat-like repeat-containing protein family member 6 n=1 Tax=Anas platyrhynchos TaxID=8839 RepID=UPI003AF31578